MTEPDASHGTISTLPPSANGSAPPPQPAPQRPRRAPDRARLSLDPAAVRQAGVHGGWWPRSRDAAAELPGLIAELSARAGRVSRVAVQIDAFVNIPQKLAVGGRKVPVAWFRYMNKHTVIVTMADRDHIVLLVIPPMADPAAAAEALGLAASGRRAGPPEAILAAASIAAGSDTASKSRSTCRCPTPPAGNTPWAAPAYGAMTDGLAGDAGEAKPENTVWTVGSLPTGRSAVAEDQASRAVAPGSSAPAP